MKIKNWYKINGFGYKGYCLVNPIHNADETCYYADVLNLNLSDKPKWHLELAWGEDDPLQRSAGLGPDIYVLYLCDLDLTSEVHRIELHKSEIMTLALFISQFEKAVDMLLEKIEILKRSK
jgi:hypothetical protein